VEEPPEEGGEDGLGGYGASGSVSGSGLTLKEVAEGEFEVSDEEK
jgi:hypothetical protein